MMGSIDENSERIQTIYVVTKNCLRTLDDFKFVFAKLNKCLHPKVKTLHILNETGNGDECWEIFQERVQVIFRGVQKSIDIQRYIFRNIPLKICKVILDRAETEDKSPILFVMEKETLTHLLEDGAHTLFFKHIA